MAKGDEWVAKHDLSTLRVLGTVGEPINPEAWKWYFEIVGKGCCSIADTYWQTETGGHLMTPLPGKTPMKAGSCCLPCYGIEPVVLDASSGKEVAEATTTPMPWAPDYFSEFCFHGCFTLLFSPPPTPPCSLSCRSRATVLRAFW